MDTLRPILFNCPRRADLNETLPDSGGYLQVTAKVSAFFSLLTCIAMCTLQNQYYSIPLGEQNPTHSVPKLSDNWLNRYRFLCTLVPWASTFKLLATGYYRHAYPSRPILFDSPHRADSNLTLPDSGRHLPAQVSPFFSRLILIAIPTLGNLQHSIPLSCISKKNQFALFAFQRTLHLLAAFCGTIFLKFCNQKTHFILRLI